MSSPLSTEPSLPSLPSQDPSQAHEMPAPIMPAPMAREDPETVAIDYDSQRVLLVRPPSLTTLKDILRAHFGLACSNPAMILERDGLQYGDTEATPCSGKAYHRPMSLRIDPKRCKETSQTIVLWHGKSATIIDVSPSVKACKELALRHLGLTEPADQDIKLFWKSKTGEQMEVCSDRFMQGIEPMSHFVLKTAPDSIDDTDARSECTTHGLFSDDDVSEAGQRLRK